MQDDDKNEQNVLSQLTDECIDQLIKCGWSWIFDECTVKVIMGNEER